MLLLEISLLSIDHVRHTRLRQHYPRGVSHGGRQYSTLKTWGAGEQVAGKLQVELSYIRERERKGEYRELERGTKQSATTLKTY